jgi:2-iminobutanoate/2-iminopropanoate deaminase
VTIKRTRSGPGLPTGFPFSLAGEANGVCFISGMPALDAEGRFVAGSFVEETDLAWRNIIGIAEVAGYAVGDIVYVQCVLADIGNYDDIND